MKQQIPLVKVRFLDNFTDPENPREMFRPGIMRQAVITNEKLIQNICNHSGQKEAQVIAVLAALPDAVKDYATAGHSVQIDNLCTISPVIHCRAVDTPEECNAQTIKSVGVKVLPIGKSAALYKKWAFRMVGDVVTGTANGDDGGVDEPNTGGQTGGNTQQPTLEPVTYTFKYHDNTEDSRVGLPGAAVDAPEPDEGYHWNVTVPTVFGSSNRTFTEVADAQGGGTGNTGGGGTETYTATIHVGEMYVTRTGAVGSALDLPQLESGYTWPSNMPTVMPAQDFTVYAIEGEQDTTTEYTLTIQHNGETLRTEQLHADDIVFLGTAPNGYKWTNTPRYSKMPARDWTVSTAAV